MAPLALVKPSTVNPANDNERPTAMYWQLRNGAWGIKGKGPAPEPGTIVTAVKRSGETKDETVDRILFAKDGAWGASIGRMPRKVQPRAQQQQQQGSSSSTTKRSGGRGTRASAAAAARPVQACETCGRDYRGNACGSCSDLGDLLY